MRELGELKTGLVDEVELGEQAEGRFAAIGGQSTDELVAVKGFDSAGVFAADEASATEVAGTVHFIIPFDEIFIRTDRAVTNTRGKEVAERD